MIIISSTVSKKQRILATIIMICVPITFFTIKQNELSTIKMKHLSMSRTFSNELTSTLENLYNNTLPNTNQSIQLSDNVLSKFKDAADILAQNNTKTLIQNLSLTKKSSQQNSHIVSGTITIQHNFNDSSQTITKSKIDILIQKDTTLTIKDILFSPL